MYTAPVLNNNTPDVIIRLKPASLAVTMTSAETVGVFLTEIRDHDRSCSTSPNSMERSFSAPFRVGYTKASLMKVEEKTPSHPTIHEKHNQSRADHVNVHHNVPFSISAIRCWCISSFYQQLNPERHTAGIQTTSCWVVPAWRAFISNDFCCVTVCLLQVSWDQWWWRNFTGNDLHSRKI